MNKLIVIPITVLILLNLVFEGNFEKNSFSFSISNPQNENQKIVFGNFMLNNLYFIFTFLGIIAGISLLASIQIFGSGLQSSSVIVSLKIGGYVVLYGLLSYNLIPMLFNEGYSLSIWLIMSIFYTIGVISEISSYGGV